MKWIKRSDKPPPNDGSWILTCCVLKSWNFYVATNNTYDEFHYWMPIISPEEEEEDDDESIPYMSPEELIQQLKNISGVSEELMGPFEIQKAKEMLDFMPLPPPLEVKDGN